MLTMFVRAFVLYVLVILLMRLMGKRQIGQLQRVQPQSVSSSLSHRNAG